MRIGIANKPVIPTPAFTATPVSQTQINLSATYAGIPFQKTFNFEFASSVDGPFTAFTPSVTPTFQDTTLVASQTRFYRVRVQTTDGRLTPYSTISSATTQAAPVNPTTSLRSNFGIYPSFYYAGGVSNSTFTNNDHGIISANANVQQIAGWHAQIYWRTVDKGVAGASVPAYDWSVMDAYVNAAAAAGKQMWFSLVEAFIGNNASVASGAKVAPDWVSSKMGGSQFSTINYDTSTGIAGGVATKRYSATLIGYWIQFLRDVVARYDNNPAVEGITFWEESAYAMDHSGTSVTPATPGADFSPSQQIPQLVRIFNAIRDPAQINAQKMNVFMGANYLFQGQFDTQASWNTVFAAMKAAKSGFMGPDTWIQNWTATILPITNANYPQQNANAVTNTPHSGRNGYFRSLPSDNYYRGWFGGTDWRGQVLCFPRCEVTDLGGYITKSLSPVPTPQELYATRILYDKTQYFSFDVITPFSGYTGNGTGAFPGAGPNQQWSTGGLPWLKTLSLPTTNQTSPYS